MEATAHKSKSESSSFKEKLKFSDKGHRLIRMYEKMVVNGYDRVSQPKIQVVYEDFELRLMKKTVRDTFHRFNIKSVLDYGSGGCNWSDPKFDESGKSAAEYFHLDDVKHYEPARDIDEREVVDCVLSFDVLEHVYISDIPLVLRDMFSYARKLLVLNVACYEAEALLPNGENAHITIRHPHWWKGMLDNLSIDFPHVSVFLLTSLSRGKAHKFPIFSDQARQADQRFSIGY